MPRKVSPLLFVASLLFLTPSPVFSQSSAENPCAAVEVQLRSLEERLRRIEADGQKVQSQQEKILAELDRIRVWVHRR